VRYAAFLRGVNVGGVNLKMADLTSALSAAGFGSVRTVLASGNVLLEASDDSAASVRDGVETALRQRFGYEAWALVYDMSTVRSIAEGYPFPEAVDWHSYVTFVGDLAVLDELAALAPPAGRPERIARGDGVLYWQVPRSGTLDSTIGRTMGRKRYKASTTTRNLRTLGKVLHAAR